MASTAPPFPIPSSLISHRRSVGFLSLPILPQNFKTCPLSHFSAKCSSADDNFFQELHENSAEMSAKLAKLGLAAVLAYGLFDGVTCTSFFVLAFLGYEKTTGNNPAANLQALLGVTTSIQQNMAHQTSLGYNGKSKSMFLTRPRRCFEPSKNNFSSYNQSSDIPRSPANALEFLSRPWSPSSSDLLQMFSSTNLLLKDSGGREDYEEQGEEMSESSSNRTMTHKQYIKLDLNHMKGWLKGKSSFWFFRSHQEKKEKLRLQTAELHALLSLTQLASAIAGFASNSGLQVGGETSMGGVVASAAALMTTVCAEAAESLGAARSQVSSAVNSGLAIQTPMDMISVTATAATCLRGAAILKSRAMEDSSPRIPKMLTTGVRIWIIMPSGHKEDKWVTLHLKQNQLILSLKRKYFGALRTSKEYKLINIIRECLEHQGHNLLSLKTNNGIIKLLFEDEMQSSIWISTISNVLKIHKTS